MINPETTIAMKIGKLSINALKRSVLRQLNTRREEVMNGAGIGEDCATFAFSDHAMTVSCMQEAAVAPEADIGEKCSAEERTMAQLVHKCANNLAVKGAEPVAALITLLLPESAEEHILKELMSEAEKICNSLHMQIAGGQTRITAAAVTPYAVVSGIGKLPPKIHSSLSGAKPGQDVVVSKWIGLEGTAYFARKYKEKLSERYPAYLVEEAAGFDKYLSIIPEAAVAVKSGVCAMHDVSEGGIFGALWEFSERAGVGLTIDFKKLPLRQETVEVCECCDVNPYELLSGGSLIMASEDGPALVEALKAEGIPAVTVGKVTDSNDRILFNGGEVRYMDRPKCDEIYGGLKES